MMLEFSFLADIKEDKTGEKYINSYSMDNGKTWFKPTCVDFTTKNTFVKYGCGSKFIKENNYKNDFVYHKGRYEIFDR